MSAEARVFGIPGGLLAVVAFLALLVWTGPAAATEHLTWLVARAEGSVTLGIALDRMRPARLGDRLPPGTLVDTGADGRLTIIRGRDAVSAGPGARFVVAGDPDAPPDGIAQHLGRLLFDMETRESRSFGVDTPLLAVTIKGTRFTVDVSPAAVAVVVDAGVVQVAVHRSRETALIEAGFTAVVTAATGTLEVRPTATRAESDSPAESVPTVDTALTDGVGDVVGGVADATADAAAAAADTVGAAADAAGVSRSVERSVRDTVGGVTGGLP